MQNWIRGGVGIGMAVAAVSIGLACHVGGDETELYETADGVEQPCADGCGSVSSAVTDVTPGISEICKEVEAGLVERARQGTLVPVTGGNCVARRREFFLRNVEDFFRFARIPGGAAALSQCLEDINADVRFGIPVCVGTLDRDQVIRDTQSGGAGGTGGAGGAGGTAGSAGAASAGAGGAVGEAGSGGASSGGAGGSAEAGAGGDAQGGAGGSSAAGAAGSDGSVAGSGGVGPGGAGGGDAGGGGSGGASGLSELCAAAEAGLVAKAAAGTLVLAPATAICPARQQSFLRNNVVNFDDFVSAQGGAAELAACLIRIEASARFGFPDCILGG